MTEEQIMNQIATLRRLDEAVLRHLVLDMAVSALSSPDGLAHQTMSLAKLAYHGMGAPAPQNGAALPAPERAGPGRPKKLPAPVVETESATRAEILTRAQTAARLGVSLVTIDRLFKTGRLHRVKVRHGKGTGKGGPRVGARAAEVDALLSGQAAEPPPEPRPKRGGILLGKRAETARRRSPGTLRDWVLAYARRHRGVVLARDIKQTYRGEYGKDITGGRLYKELNNTDLFRKEGEGRGNTRFILSRNTEVAAPVVRREPLRGLGEDILAFGSGRGGNIVMREYNRHFDEKFGAGAASSRTGSIYGAVAQLIKKGQAEKVSTGVYRLLPEPVAAAANE